MFRPSSITIYTETADLCIEILQIELERLRRRKQEAGNGPLAAQVEARIKKVERALWELS